MLCEHALPPRCRTRRNQISNDKSAKPELRWMAQWFSHNRMKQQALAGELIDPSGSSCQRLLHARDARPVDLHKVSILT
jgi:hypothetical protein